MKSLKDNFPRRSFNPSKNLIWIWLSKDLKSMKPCSFGIDAACGNMQQFPIMKVENYIGFDIDEKSVSQGLENFPNASGFVCSLEKVLEQRNDLYLKGDLVICIQTLGINSNFDSENLLTAVGNLIKLTAHSGTLIMNIRWSKNEFKYQKFEIEKILKSNFSDIRSKSYGSFDSLSVPTNSKLNLLFITYPITIILYVFPFVRKFNIFRNNSTYFVCKK
jgi:hypothetical protein